MINVALRVQLPVCKNETTTMTRDNKIWRAVAVLQLAAVNPNLAPHGPSRLAAIADH